MEQKAKEPYQEPQVIKHEPLVDITGANYQGQNGQGQNGQ